MKRFAAASAAFLIAGAAAGIPHFGSAQTANAWPTFHGDQTRDGISSVSGTTAATVLNHVTIGASVLQGGIPSSPVTDAAGNVYIGSGTGNVYSINPATDAVRWTFKTGGAVASTPALSPDGKTVYVGSADGNVYALSADAGTKVWQRSLGGAVRADPLVSGDGGSIYIPTTSGTLYSLNSADGTTRWSFSPGGAMPTSVAASPDGNTLYVVAQDKVYPLPTGGVASGQIPNPYYLDGNGTSTPAVDSNGNIYVGTDRGVLDQFSPTSGTPTWRWTSTSGTSVTSTPTFLGGNAIFGAAGGIFAVSQSSGTQVWHAPAASAAPVNSSPVVATGNGTIYIGSTDGNVYALNTQGNVVFARNLGGAIDTSPAIAPNGSVWVAGNSGDVYRLGAIPAPPPVSTITPQAAAPTSTPVPTTTTPATSTPTATATVALIPLTMSIRKGTVKDGQKQFITITSTPNTTVHIRVDYPNGDHQSAGRKTNASGTLTYSYKQGASKTKHNKFVATVSATVGSGAARNRVSKTYRIKFGKIDVSAEPRTVAVGKVVDIFIHTRTFTRVVAYILPPNAHLITRYGRTGKKGLASIKVKITSGMVRGSKRKVTVIAKLKGGNPRIATKTKFTIK